MSSHAKDRLPSLRLLIAHVAAIGGPESKAEAADRRARMADFVLAHSERAPESTPANG